MADNIDKQVSDLENKFRAFDDAIDKTSDKIRKKLGKSLADSFSSVNKDMGKFVGTTKTLNQNLDSTKNLMSKAMDIASKMAGYQEEAVKLQKRIEKGEKDLTKEAENLRQKIEEQATELKKVNVEAEKQGKIAESARDKWGKVGEGADKAGDIFKSVWAGDVRGTVAAAKSAKGLAETLIGMGGVAKKVGGLLMGMASGPGLLIVGIAAGMKALHDFALAADKYVTDLNKAFAEIRGPDLGPAKRDMRTFNDAVFSLQDNLQTGLMPKQVQQFYADMASAGQRVLSLSKDMAGYRDIVYTARKAQLTFGTDLTTTAKTMTDMMLDLQMSIGKVDHAFEYMTEEARSAGVSSDRFLTSVMNTNVGLSFYGEFIDKASKSVSAFIQAQVGGAKDSAQAAEDMYKAWSDMSVENAAYMFYATDKKTRTAMQDSVRKSFEIQKDDITAEINLEKKKGAPDLEKIRKLEERQASVQGKMHLLDKARGPMGMAVLRKFYTKAFGEQIVTMTKAATQIGVPLADMNSTQILQYKEIGKMMGMSESTLDMLHFSALSNKESLSQVSENINKVDSTIKNDPKAAAAAEDIATVLNTVSAGVEKMSEESKAQAQAQLETSYKQVGLNANQAKKFAQASMLDTNFAKKTLSLFQYMKQKSTLNPKQLSKLNTDLMSEYSNAADLITQANNSASDMGSESSKKLHSTAMDTMSEMVSMTTSLSDMEEIFKDSAKYNAAMYGQVQNIGMLVKALVQATDGGSDAMQDIYNEMLEKQQKVVDNLGIKGDTRSYGALEKLVASGNLQDNELKAVKELMNSMVMADPALKKATERSMGDQAKILIEIKKGLAQGKHYTGMVGLVNPAFKGMTKADRDLAVERAKGESRPQLKEEIKAYDNLMGTMDDYRKKLTEMPAETREKWENVLTTLESSLSKQTGGFISGGTTLNQNVTIYPPTDGKTDFKDVLNMMNTQIYNAKKLMDTNN